MQWFHKFYLLLLVSLLTIFVSCNSNKKIKIISKSFDSEVDRTENISFVFNKDIVPDSMFLKWRMEEYLTFTPPIKGRYQWKSANELTFSPSKVLPPNSVFTAKLSDKLAKINGKKFKVDTEQTFDFHTPYLKLESNNIFWQQSSVDKDNVAVGLNLTFNHKINPKDLIKKLSVKIDNEPVKYDITSTSTSNSIQVEVRNVDITEEPQVMFAIDRGMAVLGANSTTKEILQEKITLEPPTTINISGIEANHDGFEGKIYINTSQQVNPSNDLKKLITLTPNVPFTVESNMNGFTISSETFDPAKTYELKISKNLSGIFKGTLDTDYSSPISFGRLEPSISFVDDKATYISNKGYKNVALKVVNIDNIKVKITKVFANNLMAFMRQGKRYKWHDYYDENSDSWDYYDYYTFDTNDYGKVISEITYSTKDLDKIGKLRLLHLAFDDKLSRFEGSYVVEISDSERSFINDIQVIAMSDIGLITKQEKDRIHVFANSLVTAKPLVGTTISFISATNQKIFSTTTNDKGVAIFDAVKQKKGNFEVAMITAQGANDFNYMMLNKTNVNTSRFEVGGKRSNASNYDAFIYGDRNLYRPGETVNISTIVRTSNWETPNNIPIKLKMLLPNGKEYKTIRKTLNAQGAAETAITIPANMVTGTYTVEAYTANDILINSKPISVEEFMPDRIKVDVAVDKKEAKPGEPVTLSGTALNLFGPPATDRNYEVEMSLKRKTFLPKGFADYSFYIDKKQTFGKQVREGKTDKEGKFTEDFDIPAEYTDMGVLQGRFFTTVFDESGRPVNRGNAFEVFTQDVFYGIGNFDTYVSTRNPVNIPLVAIDKSAKTVNEEAAIEVIRYKWRTVLESTSNGRYRYKSQKEEITEVNKLIKLSGRNSTFAYTPSRSGSYEIRVKRPGSKNYVKEHFYAYRYEDTESTSFEVNKEGKVDIQFDKEKYNVGETAKVLFKTPFNGRLLVTVERDEIMTYTTLSTNNKAAEFTIGLGQEHVPNVFVSATLIRPMKELNVPLTVAHGYAPLIVENANNRLPLKIVANEKSRSKSKQNISIETTPNTQVAIAVVDEGILQIKNYKTPDPYGFFYQQRALGVQSYDLYPLLFNEMIGRGKLLGGGDDLGLAKRTNPVTNKRVKLVSFWSGLLESDGSGKINYEIDIPQFSGDLRVMAVAYQGKRFASESTNMKVADPVIISTGLPRFLSPNDTVIVPVTLANTTDKKASGQVSLSTSGLLKVVGKPKVTTDIEANAEKRVQFKVLAPNNIGAGKITVAINALGETFTNETDITVRPLGSLQKKSGSGFVDGGKKEVLDLATKFTPESTDGTILVSKSPLAEFGEDIAYLVRYPHGCVEQTVSKAFPQLYYYELSSAIGKEGRTATNSNSNNPNYNVQQAIKKLESMQRPDGGLSYWPGGSSASWWGSAFASHFLIEAEKAGFEVNDKTIINLKRFLKRKLKKKKTFVYQYYDDKRNEQKKEIAPKEVAYSLYILALAGSPDVSTMNYYKAKPSLLSLDAQYVLAAAYKLAGDKAKFNSMLPASFSGEQSKPVYSGSFYSPLRDKALALNALVESEPNHQQVGILTKHLVTDFKQQRYKNTQERVFTILALGKVAKTLGNKEVKANITANGKTIGTFSGKDITLNYADFKANKITINATGAGKLYYFWSMEGLTTDGSYTEEDNFIRVRRTFYDRYGREVEDLSFKQNDLVVIKLALKSLGSNTVDNVVVTDILPAGFEIENPRIGGSHEMDWIKNSTTPEHQDFRDDRVHLFTQAKGTERSFYYIVRAVSPGYFQMGPASADAMYAGEYHSYHGAGTVEVKMK